MKREKIQQKKQEIQQKMPCIVDSVHQCIGLRTFDAILLVNLLVNLSVADYRTRANLSNVINYVLPDLQAPSDKQDE